MANRLAYVPYKVDPVTKQVDLVSTVTGEPGKPANAGGLAVHWRPNTPFEATLEFTGEVFKSNWFQVQDVETDSLYGIFSSDLSKYIRADLISQSRITGRWMVVRRNTSYGVQLTELN